jgi:hypothetical protein
MKPEYSVKTYQELEEIFRKQKILRPLRVHRYDPGTELTYEVKGIAPAGTGRLKFEVEEFVGGGFAGQVYKVKVKDLQPLGGQIQGLQESRSYAMKIFIPPSGFSRLFRNLIYALGFQGPFSLQVNPDAVRAGALWQKFIRKGAGLKLGSEESVVDILATFVDTALGSCGEISEWIDGRLWRLESDDNLDARRKWKAENPEKELGSPEYREKRSFMKSFVRLMHEMGAFEIARQYEWWTCKSQPNVLKRTASDPNPAAGHVAVDFRAGLALHLFLPMSPGDFKLIFQGIGRGSLVQFDRGSIARLQEFTNAHPEDFAGMKEALEELKEKEKLYRDSLPDIPHHHIRLLFRPRLWASILNSSITGWKIRNTIEEEAARRLEKKRFLAAVLYILGLLPFLGRFIRKLWGRKDYRQHFGRLLTSLNYLGRAVRARIAEILIRWHRSGRVDEKRAKRLAEHPSRFFAHLPLAIFPAKIHKFFSDWRFFLRSLDNIFVRPLRLYFKAEAREKWLREIISQGQKNGMLTKKEATHITSQIKEPFIQKYLKSLAVHICTLPVTQIVSVAVALIYVRLHPELSWQQATFHAGIILGLFQLTPISPGSLVRGLYVTGLVLQERNFKDYSIAFFLSFFKYIGYLAFPIQMAYRYPDLARFMAGHWATGAAHIVPVFGERGALLEHAVFDLFYNFPLNIRRRVRERQEKRAGSRARYWHLSLCLLGGALLLAAIDVVYFKLTGHIPAFGDIWWLALWIPALAAATSSAWAGGATLPRRMALGVICGVMTGLLYAALNILLGHFLSPETGEAFTALLLLARIGRAALWWMFLFAILAVIGAFLVETRPVKHPAPSSS